MDIFLVTLKKKYMFYKVKTLGFCKFIDREHGNA